MKTIRSQSGIAHLGMILLIVIILGGIGIAGWIVYSKNKSRQTDQTQQTKTENKPQKAAQKESIPKPPEGFKEYKNTELELAFAYPEDWKLHDEPNPALLMQLVAESPDIERFTSESGMRYIAEGGEFVITAQETTSNDFREENGEHYIQIKGSETEIEYFTYKSTITVDGVEALKGVCGHNNPGICVYVLRNKKLFSFDYYQPNRNVVNDVTTPSDKYVRDFDTLVSSIKFTK